MRRLSDAFAALIAALAAVVPARAASPPVTSVVAREVTVLNDPRAVAAPLNVPAREVIVLNDPKGVIAPTAVATREVVVLNDPKAFAGILSVLAREVTVQAGAVPPPGQAVTALTLAGGLATATPAQKTALNVATGGSSANTLDLLDAVRLARKAAGLE